MMHIANGLVTITITDGVLTLVAPYNRALKPAARPLGGRWDPTTKAWRFDARDEERVRALALSIYGMDGTEDPFDTVTARVPTSSYEYKGVVTVAGRIIAERRQRDYAVDLAHGVVLVEGRYAASGGSRATPLIGPNDAVLEVRDIPRRAALEAGLTIVEESDGQREALMKERERLLDRLVEIDKELGGSLTEAT